ncbi:MAG: response regulator transcription factor [Chitinophagaceae bacterium]|nr:response regulator transcription factor [Chitinophagaceae bacterium]
MKQVNIHIAVIEDDPVVRKGLEKYFRSQPEFGNVTAIESVENLFENNINFPELDIVLTDIGLPGKSGIEGIKLIKDKKPEVDVIMITVFTDADKIFQSLCAGATGYILKGASFDEIKESVFTILNGGSYMSPSIARKIVEYFKPAKKNSQAGLSIREEQIIKCLIEGLSYKLIAARLTISTDTVRFHIKNIYSKLQVNSKSEVIARYFKEKE